MNHQANSGSRVFDQYTQTSWITDPDGYRIELVQ